MSFFIIDMRFTPVTIYFWIDGQVPIRDSFDEWFTILIGDWKNDNWVTTSGVVFKGVFRDRQIFLVMYKVFQILQRVSHFDSS